MVATMLKRKREVNDEYIRPLPLAKRTKSHSKNRFEDLSDELVLRTLSFLTVPEIAKAETICRRFRQLGSDNEIWREKFYNQFVRPRARRIPALSGMTEDDKERHALNYASKRAKWLEHATKSGAEIDWKRRYKVKLNWSKGRCKAHEVALDCPIKPRIIAKVSNGIIFTASSSFLRSYSQRSRPQLLSTYYWENEASRRPTAIDIDRRDGRILVIVGFASGTFEIYHVDDLGVFSHAFTQPPKSAGALTSLAVSWPYVLSMHRNQLLELYEMHEEPSSSTWTARSLADLHSERMLEPVSLSIRTVSNTLIASIAYAFSRLNAGWCLGLQEIRLSLSGNVVGSRLTSTIDTPLHDHPLRSSKVSSRSAATDPLPLHPQLMHAPNALSHSGCYILAGLPDNTLMVYTLTSDDSKLEINAGRRLWGHTSSVSGAEVSERGKALSISAKGEEVRIWELEEILSSRSLRRTSTELHPWPRPEPLQVALAQRGDGLGLALGDVKHELPPTRHWVGFDDEQVVVLGEREQRQVLSCYDFA